MIAEVPGTMRDAGASRSTGLPVLWGYTHEGRYIIVVYEEVDDATIRVITAYDVPEP